MSKTEFEPETISLKTMYIFTEPSRFYSSYLFKVNKLHLIPFFLT